MNNQQQPITMPTANNKPIQVETFNSFPVNQVQTFDILLANNNLADQLLVTISNSNLGILDKQLEWQTANNQQQANKCRVSFKAPIVGIYTINVKLAYNAQCVAQFQAKAYDLSKVFINNSSKNCRVNESYEFGVDASEAGEGQLEIAVNEGEIPNQVQVLDNGMCIVNFVPEEVGPHEVDIKFNGHNVNGCPFIVDVTPALTDTAAIQKDIVNIQQQVPTKVSSAEPILIVDERILINQQAVFSLENLSLSKPPNKDDILIIDPESNNIPFKLTEDCSSRKFRFEFSPKVVGDYTVELKESSEFYNQLPNNITKQFPFPIKVFDYTKVFVSDVTDGVIGHPIYFFIDASQAGSGNLEISVCSKTRNVPNYPQSEANAKIRVYFTPTEAVEHSIDIKFNGIPVPGNPFLVKVAQYPQARLPVGSKDLLKYVAIDDMISFYVDYIGQASSNQLSDRSCELHVLGPDFDYTKIDTIEYIKDKKKFKVSFKPNKIGPFKLFLKVNNELLPCSPLICNVFNIHEVKVSFNKQIETIKGSNTRPSGQLNKPVTFTVDASRAGEGTLSLAVVSIQSRTQVQTDVQVADQSHGLYNLTFVPTEFATHSIDMSFNDQVVPGSPFMVDILNSEGRSSSEKETNGSSVDNKLLNRQQQQLVQNFDNLNLGSKSKSSTKQSYPSGGTTSRKSLAYGLINASNIVYLESGVLESSKAQINLIGPNKEQVPFILAKGSLEPGEPKKPYIEYNPKSIGTHKISIFDEGLKDLREYFVEICDPSLIRIIDINPKGEFVVGKAVTFSLDTKESGQIQLDAITIIGPCKSTGNPSSGIKTNGKARDSSDQTILGRIKSISSSSSSTSNLSTQAQNNLPLEYTVEWISEHKQQVRFVPQVAGKHSIEIRCLGQMVGQTPFEIEVKNSHQGYENNANNINSSSKNNKSSAIKNNNNNIINSKTATREIELLRTIVVHGVSLKCTPVNSTGAFIIETNNLAQARDFDVLITDPDNSLVNVQCYLQQDGNLLAEWTPSRVGTHKIEVLYKNQQVPGSPFITEAFDPSSVIVENLKSLVYSVNDKIELRLNRKQAGYGDLDVAIISPGVNQELPIHVEQVDDYELISFTPTLPGKYKMTITFGGFEVPKSPITFVARDDSLASVKVSGSGLKCAEVNRTAQFNVDSGQDGELKIRIECGDREIVPKIEKTDRSYTIKYKPIDIGYANISLYWNGTHIDNSPYSVPINDLSRILFLSGTNKSSNTNNQRIIDYEPKIAKEITVDTSKCGPGELKAEAYCRANPNLKFSIPLSQYVLNRYKLVFECPPRSEQVSKGVNLRDFSTEATYMIRFIYNNVFVPENLASVVVSPLHTTTKSASTQPLAAMSNKGVSVGGSLERSDNGISQINKTELSHAGQTKKSGEPEQVNCPVVALRGHGLVDAKRGEVAEFTIDGSEAGPGKPEVRFSNGAGLEDISVKLEQIESRIYKATYVAQSIGVYSLNVLWAGKQVAGCPIKVDVLGNCDPSRVICTGDGLKGGVLGEEIKCFIDTRRAGPGELTAMCTGPQKVAFCELLDRGDGTFVLYIRPQEPGRQFLNIKYAGQHIPKSPFLLKVSGRPDPSKVRVHGPGVEHGVLSLYQSRFVCDTRGAGAGQLTVRIRGPKGAFRMETQRESQKDRTILCKYDPTEPGDYRIEIKWSGVHVPGSPFSVMIFDTKEELNRFLMSTSHHHNNNTTNNKMLANNPALHHQVPYEPTMVEYGHYSNMATQQGAAHQKPYRLQ